MGDFMRDDYKEQLSALIDDELRREESRFLTARVGEDVEARQRIGEYATIRHVLQDSLPPASSEDPRYVAKRVAVALEDEPAHDGDAHRRAGRRWLQPVAGMALAAGVAAVTLAVWPTGDVGQSGRPIAAVDAPTASPAADASAQNVADQDAPTSGVRTASTSSQGHDRQRLDPAMQQRLNRYMINHSGHSSSAAVGRVMTYVRIAGQEADE